VLCNNALESVPETLLQFRNLAELDLSNNAVSFLPDSLAAALTGLTHLSLRNNRISDADFPKDLSGLVTIL
jgi:Leucine-rich repeat (LRR) protein